MSSAVSLIARVRVQHQKREGGIKKSHAAKL